MRKVDDGKKKKKRKKKRKKKIMMKIVATNVVASRPTGMLTAHAKIAFFLKGPVSGFVGCIPLPSLDSIITRNP